ncbi:hypothetical protein B0T17DRAFT_359923 [Bombardia bombarda]|uniref:GH18 domain-containing protein n=1 Tax=Bombardia bombarda TaxID=252184 RepID=A0AA40BW54_9PEZI|nr:hypothetical protein B0T17DRAFT_359923 [Bombardia bombarda]
MYEMLLVKGWPAEKIVVGLVTNPENGSGWVPWDVLGNLMPLLVARHARFGGVMGWEYFNSLGGGKRDAAGAAAAAAAAAAASAKRVDGQESTIDQVPVQSSSSARANGKTTAADDVMVVLADDDDGDGNDVNGVKGRDEALPVPVPAPFDYYSDEAQD